MIRQKNNISNHDYLDSIGVDHFISNLVQAKVATMSELISSGKSGSFFYYTADGKYTIKTIHKKEFEFLKKILKSYYIFLNENPSTFLTKFTFFLL